MSTADYIGTNNYKGDAGRAPAILSFFIEFVEKKRRYVKISLSVGVKSPMQIESRFGATAGSDINKYIEGYLQKFKECEMIIDDKIIKYFPKVVALQAKNYLSGVQT